MSPTLAAISGLPCCLETLSGLASVTLKLPWARVLRCPQTLQLERQSAEPQTLATRGHGHNMKVTEPSTDRPRAICTASSARSSSQWPLKDDPTPVRPRALSGWRAAGPFANLLAFSLLCYSRLSRPPSRRPCRQRCRALWHPARGPRAAQTRRRQRWR
jgi:hypothetical protein